MSAIECSECHMMAACPQRSTRATVLDYSAPDCTVTEYFTEYQCANCLYSFARSMPSHSPSAPLIRELPGGGFDPESTMPPMSERDWAIPRGFRTMGFQSNGMRYSGPRFSRTDQITSNRKKRTAKLSDIKVTTRNDTVTDEYCITEMNMEMGK